MTDRDDLVSIVMPLFDARPFVRRAVGSALEQTHPAVELIVVDDGSTDGGADEIRDLVDGGRVRLLAQANAGASAARNAGVRASRGEHLLFLDSDDELDPRCVEGLLAALEPGGLAYCDASLVDVDGATLPGRERIVAGARLHREGNLLPALAFGGYFAIHSMLVPKARFESVAGFDERYSSCEDFHLWLRLFAEGANARFVDAPLARYRMRPGSKSSGRENTVRWTKRALDEVGRQYPGTFEATRARCSVELRWIQEQVKRHGEAHLRRCRDHVRELEEAWRAASREPEWIGRPRPDPVTAALDDEPPEVAGRYVTAAGEDLGRLFLQASRETEALWRSARKRLEECEHEARLLGEALARRRADSNR